MADRWKKITRADTVTIPSFVYPGRKMREADLGGAVKAFYGPKVPAGRALGSSSPSVELLNATRSRNAAMSSSAPKGQDSISSYDLSWSERIGDAAGRMAMRLGAGRDGYQYASAKARDVADIVPGVSEAVASNEVRRALGRGDYTGAAIGTAALAAGAAPLAGDWAAKAIRRMGTPLREMAEPVKELASKALNIYDPPMKKPRDFALDYPKGADIDANGRLRTDIEGRPLGSGRIAGRQDFGGADRPIDHDGIRHLGSDLTREGIRRRDAGALGGDLGRTRFDKIPDLSYASPVRIEIAKGLPQKAERQVVAHEVGHVIDETAGQIPADGLGGELDRIYSTLAMGKENSRSLIGPGNFGYEEENWPREHMAEAIRAYMTDPNYIKTVAPKTAARIREHVNGNPALRDVIQFNSFAGPAIGAGLAGYGALEADRAEAASSPRLPDIGVIGEPSGTVRADPSDPANMAMEQYRAWRARQ